MTNVFLCVNDFFIIKELMDFESNHRSLRIVGISTTVINNLMELESLNIDVLVLQFSVEQSRCIQLLSELSVHEKLQKLSVLPLFKELDSTNIHLLLQYAIQNFLVEPILIEQLTDAICKEGVSKGAKSPAQWNIETVASELMLGLGLPAHLFGFGYIRTSAILIARDFIGMRIAMGSVYCEAARRHQTTASRVEKSIRTTIQYAYRTQPEKICIYNDKPTSSQIILYISEKLKLYDVV